MIYLNIEAASIDDLKKQMREMLGDESRTRKKEFSAAISAEPPIQEPTWRDSSLPAKTSGPNEDEPKTEEEPPKEEQAKTYSLVEVRAAANAYRDKHGIEKLREIFKKHGGEKLKDIPESSYAALMEDIA